MLAKLSTHNLTKAFGSRTALDRAELNLYGGEIHALVGANGAGKSTLAWLLAGRYADYSGRILLDGCETELRSRAASRRCRIELVTQEPSLLATLPVSYNLVLGGEASLAFRRMFLRRATIRSAAAALVEELDLRLPCLDIVCEALSLENRQIVDLGRAAFQRPRLLILDEPPIATDQMAGVILQKVAAKLRSSGTAILVITHHVSKAMAIADRVSVIRDGRIVLSEARGALTRDAVVEAMFDQSSREGRESAVPLPEEGVAAQASRVHSTIIRGAINSARYLRIETRTTSGELVHFDAPDNTVVGIRPLRCGGSDVLRSVIGVGSSHATVTFGDAAPARYRNPVEAAQHGVIYLSGDRETEGLFPNLSVSQNLILLGLSAISKGGFLQRRHQRALARHLAARSGIDPGRLDEPITNLSGGNQQKTLVGRAGGRRSRVCLIDEPNRGVDLKTLAQVAIQIRAFKGLGRWLLVASSDQWFLETLCDTVLSESTADLYE